MEEKLRNNLSLVKQTLSEHLSAINENTAELQSFFDYIQEIEQKIEKISERIDQLQLQKDLSPNKAYVAPLNATETKIFLSIYTEHKYLSCPDISEKSGVPLSIIREHLASLAQKGVPLVRSFVNNQTYYQIEERFKEWQAKENVINLSLDSFFSGEKNFQTKLKTYLDF